MILVALFYFVLFSTLSHTSRLGQGISTDPKMVKNDSSEHVFRSRGRLQMISPKCPSISTASNVLHTPEVCQVGKLCHTDLTRNYQWDQSSPYWVQRCFLFTLCVPRLRALLHRCSGAVVCKMPKDMALLVFNCLQTLLVRLTMSPAWLPSPNPVQSSCTIPSLSSLLNWWRRSLVTYALPFTLHTETTGLTATGKFWQFHSQCQSVNSPKGTTYLHILWDDCLLN